MPTGDEPIITVETLEDWGYDPDTSGPLVVVDVNHWAPYLNTNATFARRMEGPFVTYDGVDYLRCEDGYLCMDERGFPYPVGATRFEESYKQIPQGETE